MFEVPMETTQFWGVSPIRGLHKSKIALDRRTKMYIRYDKPYSEWSYKIALVYARIATWLFS
jgi:hypothetical protein